MKTERESRSIYGLTFGLLVKKVRASARSYFNNPTSLIWDINKAEAHEWQCHC